MFRNTSWCSNCQLMTIPSMILGSRDVFSIFASSNIHSEHEPPFSPRGTLPTTIKEISNTKFHDFPLKYLFKHMFLFQNLGKKTCLKWRHQRSSTTPSNIEAQVGCIRRQFGAHDHTLVAVYGIYGRQRLWNYRKSVAFWRKISGIKPVSWQ